jgi:putative chitinase
MITADQLSSLGIGHEWVDPLNSTFSKFGIDDVRKQAAFIGQCSHECNKFRTLEENLSYSAETLQRLFGHKFKPEEIQLYAHNPQKIGNRIYSNRMGNRDEASGDGWLYHGRGCIQLTGHDNYWHFGQSVGQDFVKNPAPVATPMWAAMSAGWFWSTHGCNPLAESEDWTNLTKRINGGTFGLDERISLTKHALAVLGG